MMTLKNILSLDEQFTGRLRFVDRKSPWFFIAALFAHSGDSWFWLGGFGIAWLLTPPGSRLFVSVMAGGLVALAVFVLLIKFTVRRKRPEGEWGAIYRNTDPHSFPSGHAARAAMLAVVAWGLGPIWLGWLLVFWAPLVSFSRVATGVHYLSDVVVGAILGTLTGLIILAVYPVVVSWFPFLL